MGIPLICLALRAGMGLEEAGPAVGWAKKCPGDTFLGRGRVHRRKTASRRGGGFLLFHPSGVPTKDGYFDKVAVLIVFALKCLIFGVLRTF